MKEDKDVTGFSDTDITWTPLHYVSLKLLPTTCPTPITIPSDQFNQETPLPLSVPVQNEDFGTRRCLSRKTQKKKDDDEEEQAWC